MKKVSIVIPTYNRAASMERLLKALTAQTFPPSEFEVVVSIDGSEDGTREMVENFDAPFTIRSVWQPNSGRVKACNAGIENASGEILIILDDDMEPHPGFIEAHYLSHSSGERLGVIGAAPIHVDDSSTFATRHIASEFNLRQKKMAAHDYKFRIWDFYGGTFSIRRKTLLEVGLFDESFKTYGYEDMELVRRLVKSGVKIIFNPEAVCTQYYDENLEGLLKKTVYSGERVVLLVSIHPELFSELKLREYNSQGWKWRWLRFTLIWAAMLFPPVKRLIISFIKLFEGSSDKTQARLYTMAMDYFFWLGVWSEARRNKKYEPLIPKIKSYRYDPHAS